MDATDLPATATLARFAKGLDFEDVPSATRQTVRFCLIDAVACAAFGATLPWSQSVLRVAQAAGREGRSQVVGARGTRLHPTPASLALGAFSHAFELDNLRKPGLGVHGGATVALPALAVAQHFGASGRDLVTAIVAGIEVMFRIGVATLHTPEKEGFHAPGLTGPFGAATACCLLLGASERQIMDAYGIAGSLSSGLLAFSKASQGGMVKRLHLGRAAESGVLATLLAMEGFEGPHTVLDGKYGLLDAFCSKSDASRLTAGLGEVWEADRICFKSTACHITAHSPLEAMRQLRSEFKLTADEIEAIEIEGSDKMVSHHNIKEPADIMLAQYSIPFVVAASLYRDVGDPAVFDDKLIGDAQVRDMAQRISLSERSNPDAPGGWGVDLTVILRDGRRLSRTIDVFPGTPEKPFTEEEIGAKFMTLTKGLEDPRALLERLQAIETLENVADLDLD
ncbi:MAG: hypothetical protein RLZ98_14 [Pseudomonadota bacterium]|jgi:2-methylcitrate dehydratase PrpD